MPERRKAETIDEPLAAELFDLAYRVSYRIVGTRPDAEDIAQESVARACARWAKVGDYSHAWVSKVSANMAIDTIRRRRREQSDLNAPLGTVGDPYVEERLDLAASLAKLPRRQREVVVLRYLADMSETEVANQLNVSAGTVKQHASRGLRSMRLRLDAQEWQGQP